MKIILVGKSGSGKDYIRKRLVDKYGYNNVITTTTRPKREGETEGDEYEFVSENGFKWLIEQGAMIEYRTYDTVFGRWYYGIREQKIEENAVVICTPDNVGKIKEWMGGVVVLPIQMKDNQHLLDCIHYTTL